MDEQAYGVARSGAQSSAQSSAQGRRENEAQSDTHGDQFRRSAQHSAARGVARRVVEGDGPNILGEIWSPSCGVAVWRRDLGEPFQTWLDTLALEDLPDARIVSSPASAGTVLDAYVSRHGMAEGEFRTQLAADAAMLAGAFARIMKTVSVRIRLDVISDNACRKFHLDNVEARLLCTYRGRGTQYGCSQGNADPSPIHELTTGDVGLFRGQRWPTLERCGIVHRSPPLSGCGETRLLLVVDDGGPDMCGM
ncbi:MAG: DUF1826 domain-containing protein [Methyloceanibacter sp.]|nr:DUF1826 domain-containing protein [Methyloceanibacter sp.]